MEVAFEDNELDANTKYLDKIMEVSGTVKEVNTGGKGMVSVTLDTESGMFGVICQMDNLTQHDRLDFKEGEKIKLKGICTGVLMNVILVRCVEV